jgi:hypothetical protein
MEIKLDFGPGIAAMTKKIGAIGTKTYAAAAKIIDDVTDNLQAETIKRVPIDKGLLQQSIDKTVEHNTFASEITGHVFVPANAPAKDYALYMHELEYNLGAASLQKQAGQPEKVGRKYMERAFEENKRAYELYIVSELRRAIGV